MTKKELKPCPFCGSPALLEELGDHHGNYHNLGCSSKGCWAHHLIYTESEQSVEASIAAWNLRSPPKEDWIDPKDKLPEEGVYVELESGGKGYIKNGVWFTYMSGLGIGARLNKQTRWKPLNN